MVKLIIVSDCSTKPTITMNSLLVLLISLLVCAQLVKCQEMDRTAFENGAKLTENVVDFLGKYAPYLSSDETRESYDVLSDESAITLKDLENAITGAIRFMHSQHDEIRALNLTNLLDRVKFAQDMLNSTKEIALKYQGPIDDIRNSIVRIVMTEMMANFPEILRQTREFFSNAQKSLVQAYRDYIEEVGDGNQSPQLQAIMRMLGVKIPSTTTASNPSTEKSTVTTASNFEFDEQTKPSNVQDVQSQTTSSSVPTN